MHTVRVIVSDTTSDTTDFQGRFVVLRVLAAVLVVVVWAGCMMALLAVGSCDAFGGRCDGTSPSVLDDDVAGGAFVGTAAAVWVLWWLRRPSLRAAGVGVLVAFVVGLVAALIARAVVHK
jgi:hypothetical protein